MTSSAEDALKFLESLEGDLQTTPEPTKTEQQSDIKHVQVAPAPIANQVPLQKEQLNRQPPIPKEQPQEESQYKLPTSFSFGTFNSALKTYLKDENLQKTKDNVSKNVSSIASAFISSFNVPPSMQIKCYVNAPFAIGQDTKYTLQEIWGNATKGRWGFDYEFKENHKVLFSNNWNELVSVIKAEVKPSEALSINVVINQFKWMDAEYNNDASTEKKPIATAIATSDNPQEMLSRTPLPAELNLEGYVFLIKVLDITEIGLIHGRYCQDMLWGLIENAFEQCGREFQQKYAK